MSLKNFIFIFLSLVIFISCNKKDWDNPYDEESSTNLDWAPFFSNVKQEDETVVLEFNCNETNFDSYNIERSIDNSAFSKVANLSKTANSWTDNNITIGGKLHKYRIYALAGSNKSNYGESEIIPYLPPKFNAKINYITYNSFGWEINIIDNGGASIKEYYAIYNEEGLSPKYFWESRFNENEPIRDTLFLYDLYKPIKPSTVYYLQFEVINIQNKKGFSESMKVTTKSEP